MNIITHTRDKNKSIFSTRLCKCQSLLSPICVREASLQVLRMSLLPVGTFFRIASLKDPFLALFSCSYRNDMCYHF